MKRVNGKLVLVLLLFVYAASSQAQIYTWVDENGRKQFGDTVPPAYRGKTDKITVDTIVPSKEEVERAKNKNRKIEALNNKEKQKKRSANQSSDEPEKKKYSSENERKWAEYNESLRCFQACRIKMPDRQVMDRYPDGSTYTRTIPGGYNLVNCGHCKNVPRPQRFLD